MLSQESLQKEQHGGVKKKHTVLWVFYVYFWCMALTPWSEHRVLLWSLYL